MSIEELKQMSLNDLVDIDASKLTAEEVAYIEKRLVKEANRRIRRLKQSKKLSASKISKSERKGFKSFKAPKGYTPKSTGSNKLIAKGTKKKPIDVRNKRVSNVSKVQTFLKKKTTRVREINKQAERYKKVIRDTIGKDVNLTDRQVKRIGRLMEKAKELAGLDGTNKKMTGSPRALALIVDIVKSSKYIKNADAEEIIMTAIREGYEQAQRLINDLNEEDAEGLDIMDDEDIYNG